MPLSEKKSVVFAFESSVHSSNVLLSLDEQRKQDLLCDVTILVEDQRFRAHRSVLAACSVYFRSRIVVQSEPVLVITLPEEITLKGFDPLLQFAYTSKLILDKDNVAEVCKCAEFLGIHDIEESCFQFLKFKFLDNKPDRLEYQKRKCCKQRCQEYCKTGAADYGDLEIDDGNTLQNECIQDSQLKASKTEQIAEVPLLQDNVNQTCESISERGLVFGLETQCPKYRKFQKALGTDKAPVVESSSNIKEIQVTSAAGIHQTDAIAGGAIQKPLECVAVHPNSKCANAQVKMEDDGKEELLKETVPVFQSIGSASEKMDCAFDPHNSSTATHGACPASFLNPYDQYCMQGGMQSSSSEVAEKNGIVPSNFGDCQPVGESIDESSPLKSQLCDRENMNSASPNNRSSVEREIAEQLAKGFWSDVYSTDAACPVNLSPASVKEFSEQVCSEKKTECPWLGIQISDSPEHGPPRTFATLSSVTCPFISNLSNENSTETNSGDCVSEPQPEQCPYPCVINLEEDSESDTEGDSESCSAREQECEIKLPMNPQKIISLSRNDFQSFLKMHKLTPEELDCIHDIRRRSKNRIAAQRCRKRKLDCIQNLESEIEKLQNEKENLLKENKHILSTLVETKQNLTGLCKQVCSEAALSPEQIQVLAKYSSLDCPLSFFIPERKQTEPSDTMPAVPLCVELSAGLSVASPNEQSSSYQHVKGVSDAGYDQAQELCPLPVRIADKTLCLEQCVQSSSGITDFCQQMTDKCTTDE
nr:PREDICTED: transcription regulator protein BACH1 [Anolis carolinensis]XP_008105829.1 PREDICTED: transcription regulator protein BACH1 [Anolis carolinensis]XP_016847990.1 PREDICTED: transcription regulator protein BACH1 [Anolis carolinensis]|eukprot:XP_003219110.1 PREDICTED: transcription regulator protein BACH1 [Anolis carolinensis]